MAVTAKVITGAERSALDNKISLYNKSLGESKAHSKGSLGKDDFLKILVTQLSHQDPTKPMEDKAFIAQMAQFSSLEQMKNVSTAVTSLKGQIGSLAGVSLLGKQVSGDDGALGVVTGVKTEGPKTFVRAGGTYYDLKNIRKIEKAPAATASAPARGGESL